MAAAERVRGDLEAEATRKKLEANRWKNTGWRPGLAPRRKMWM